MQPGLFFFPLYHTNEAVKDFNVLVTLTVYDGAFPDLDVVNQFLNDFPVKLLHIQIAADDASLCYAIGRLLEGWTFVIVAVLACSIAYMISQYVLRNSIYGLVSNLILPKIKARFS